tara:strand:- start:113 stop:1123 length:1011 start_codon:yes stop_codon:yes gene_type:complete
MTVIRSRAPVRISFAGGGTDVAPYSEEKGGCVVSTTINKYSYTSLSLTGSDKIKMNSHDSEELILKSFEDCIIDGQYDLAKCVLMEMQPTKGLELFFRNDVVPRSGLGSSAAAFVSLLGAFNEAFDLGKKKHELAQMAFDLERNRLKVKGGKQDQFASSYGGFNFIEFKNNEVKVSPLNMSRNTLNELEKSIVLVFTKPRETQGHDIISDQTKSLEQGNKDTINAFDAAKQNALEMKSALEKTDLEKFGMLLDSGWEEKKKYSKFITNQFIDKLYSEAKNAGAIGGKLSGAGGGGHMVFYCYPDKEIQVKEKLESLGAKIIPFSFESQGLESWSVK